MHISLNWLGDHVDLSGIAPEDIARQLTLRTALIEGVRDQRAALAGVVVGEVLECRPHPGADRLSLCRVEHGGASPAAVVCGAPNVRAGQRILFAPVGTSLPNGVKLKAAKIRGEVSEGMICAEDELGLGPEHDGILVLPAGLEPGMPAAGLEGLADVVLEIDNKSVTHRPDLWGHRGFARELAAIYRRNLRPLEVDERLGPAAAGRAGAVGAGGTEAGPSRLDVQLAGGSCTLYAGLCLEAAPVRSPDWLRFRLIACGLRPRNLPVDLSNYVMLELGQPTHPFDRDRLAGGRIVVRRATPGEPLVTLDGVARELVPDDTVIADAERAIALAGIMGGGATEVGDGTRRIVLESASFDPVAVRRTSSRLGLRTDALARFEKGLDPALVEQALRRYAALLTRLQPDARVGAGWSVAGAAAAPTRRLALSGDVVRRRLGLDIRDDEIGATLASIGFGVAASGGQLDVTVPSWRSTRDVTLPEDLVEEVGRLAGYDRVPSRPPVGPLRLGHRDPLFHVEDRLRDALGREAAFTESMAYSMVTDRALAVAGLPADAPLPRLANPLQQDASRLRPSLVPEMLLRLEGWLRHDASPRVFEIGRGYEAAAGGGLRETRELAAVMAFRDRRDGREIVRELRSVVEAGLTALGVGSPDLAAVSSGGLPPWFHPRRTSSITVAGAAVGFMGALAPPLLAGLGLAASVGILVLDLDALAGCPARGAGYRAVPRFPPARIDLAFVLPYSVTVGQLHEAMAAAGPRVLESIEAFDVYRGKPLGDQERSVAFHLVFQAADRTLTDDDVERARLRIVAAAEALGARLR